jgi:hypothetical protein
MALVQAPRPSADRLQHGSCGVIGAYLAQPAARVRRRHGGAAFEHAMRLVSLADAGLFHGRGSAPSTRPWLSPTMQFIYLWYACRSSASPA